MISYRRFLENKKISILIQIFNSSWLWFILEQTLKHGSIKWASKFNLRTEWIKRNLGM